MTLRGQVRNAEALGRMLQQGRMLHGMSQRQLAEQLGISQKWVWEMEQGKPGLLTERLFEMLRATGVRLYAEVDEPEEDAHPSEPSSDE
ncbi:helix-turn-helix domain-containing protein [uncultured Arthrobacter sp.]|uniref:helix-turn-helix domain-containing protein n=1 Tax=uncultured Arthrobacter sp. TaxID=114050 RepID=UPI00261A1EA1|nr:helix-turn-helix transcriptional regulator [uncultured Arthrobacter sp.]